MKFLSSFLILILLLWFLPVSADGKETFLPKSFSADFEQIYKSAIRKGKEKKSTGLIEYLYPGNIRFEVKAPDKLVFVSNPKKTWYYTPPFIEGQPGQVVIKTTGKLALSAFFDSLKNGLKTNNKYQVSGSGLEREIVFEKVLSSELGLRGATIHFVKTVDFQSIEKIVLHYVDNKNVTTIMKNLVINKNFKKSNFEFKVPDQTKIVY